MSFCFVLPNLEFSLDNSYSFYTSHTFTRSAWPSVHVSSEGEGNKLLQQCYFPIEQNDQACWNVACLVFLFPPTSAMRGGGECRDTPIFSSQLVLPKPATWAHIHLVSVTTLYLRKPLTDIVFHSCDGRSGFHPCILQAVQRSFWRPHLYGWFHHQSGSEVNFMFCASSLKIPLKRIL